MGLGYCRERVYGVIGNVPGNYIYIYAYTLTCNKYFTWRGWEWPSKSVSCKAMDNPTIELRKFHSQQHQKENKCLGKIWQKCSSFKWKL